MLKTMGDVIVSTTICKELRKEYPGCEIHFYTNRPYGQLLRNNPDIAEVHELSEWDLNTLYMEAVSDRYDEAFLPIQVRGECNMWHQTEEFRHQHLVDFYWKRMGMHRQIEERECYLYPSTKDYEKAGDHISLDAPRIAVHANTLVETKNWPYFKELVEEMRKEGYGCVQVGDSKDTRIPGAIDLRGKMSLLELAAFLSRCVAFVGLDSGISYMADAMKIPTVIIQGSTSPVTSGPISSRVIHLFAEKTGYDDCQQIRCHTNCRHEVNCITRIKPAMVVEKITALLNKLSEPVPVGVEP